MFKSFLILPLIIIKSDIQLYTYILFLDLIMSNYFLLKMTQNVKKMFVLVSLYSQFNINHIKNQIRFVIKKECFED